MMKVLCCDLSLSGSGFAVMSFTQGQIYLHETLFVNNKKNLHDGIGKRLDNIATALTEILQRHPDINVVVREKGFSKFPATTQTLFKVVGVSDLLIYRHGMKTTMDELAPMTIKKAVTGKGTSDKVQVATAVRKFLTDEQKQWKFDTDDISDAVAVGIAWALQRKLLNIPD